MTPLRIDIMLAGPMERPADPIHLDSLIAHLLVKRDLPPRSAVPLIHAKILELPLERRQAGSDWVWAASTIAFEWITPPSQAFATLGIRAGDIAPIQRSGFISGRAPNTKIDTARGEFKAATYARDRQWASRGVAFCIGDEEEIRDLIGNLDQIGPRRRLGAGRVTNVVVSHDERAQNHWAKRTLPSDYCGPGRLAEGAYRLPLFEPENRKVVLLNPLEISMLTMNEE